MHTKNLLAAAILFLSPLAAPASEAWLDNYYPYRLTITLADSAEGRTALTLPLQEMIDQLKTVCPDIVDIDNFAFEKAVLVEPNSGKIVGGFKFIIQSENLIKDSNFSTLGQKDSPWSGFNPAEAKIERITADGHEFTAVMVTKTAIANTRISQPLQLSLGTFYRFDYWALNDANVNSIVVQLENPKRWFFNAIYRSYIPSLLPQGRWTHQSSLVWANVAEANLNIGTAYIGSGGTGNIELQKLECRLIAELPAKTSTLHLYYLPRAGHKLTCPPEQMILASDSGLKNIKPTAIKAEVLNTNTDGVMIKGKYLTAWTLPSDYPLKAGYLKATMPSDHNTTSPLRVNICRGGDATVLVAIDTGTGLLNLVNYSSSLPIQARFERLAPIPVYDGPFPTGKLTETRFDAMMEPNDALCPPVSDGIHIIAVTLTAPKDAQAGIFKGKITCTVETPVPDTEAFEIPVELHIATVTLKPMDHFGVIFGGQYFQIRCSGEPYTKTGPCIFDFHGLPKDKRPAPDIYKTLVSKYYNRMIDFDVQPSLLAFFGNYTYTITEQGNGKAPLLSDWNFDEYDKALDEYLGKREVPWLPIWHTNGHLMHAHKLSNQTTYSFKPADGTPAWNQVSEDEYFRLVADFFEAIAQHLNEKGCLDRAIFVIDESDTTTYELIYKYKQALRQKKYASRINFAHTTYQTGAYTVKTPDGRIYMDESLEMPMPDNDEHFNFFDPSYNALYKKPKNNWVYYVETDHLNIINGGISTIITPLKLKHFGANGWYCWASFIWSMPYPVTQDDGWEFKTGPVVNPWLNPFYHHGDGMLSFFYPPDPRGPAQEPTLNVIPSYRLALIRDGIQSRALLEVLNAGKDDLGKSIKVNQAKLEHAKIQIEKLWAPNPVQWYISYGAYKEFQTLLFDSIEE